MGPMCVAVALALVAYECKSREGRKAIMAKKAAASQGLLDGSTNV